MGDAYTLRGHHVEILRKYVVDTHSNMLLAIMALRKNYGDFSGTAASKLDLMASDAENQIEITDGLDDICKAKCPYRNEGYCQRGEHTITDDEAAKFDGKFIKQFGLEKGRIYSAGDLIQRIC